MKRVVVIDGQGGKIGTGIIAALKDMNVPAQIIAVGTNSAATSNMLKSLPDAAATGENPVIVACRDADIIVGPVGIVIADSLYGEITPTMAAAIGQSRGERVLIPINKCDSTVIGVGSDSLGDLIRKAAEYIAQKL